MNRLAKAVALTASAAAAATLGIGGAAAAPPGSGVASPPAARAAASTPGATHKVIVLLKSQPAVVDNHSSAFAARRAQVAAAQAPIVSQLRATSKNVKTFQLVNAAAATVSTAEQQRLQSDPAVAAVIPDEVIKAPTAAPAAAAAATPTRPAPAGTCPTGPTPLLAPEALSVTNTNSQSPKAKTARSLGFTGAGVKVAYMAEGIDINNPDFIRADGSHVFADYQDFSGDGTAAPTDGAEAFLDASAIAAQGRHTYDVRNFSAVALQQSCKIRIEGMAPGASLVGLKVFAQNNATTTSGFLQAIEYATTVAKVDVLNESFGGNPYPDTATADAIALFNDAAVRAGVTVTASSGDAGPTNTIGSPATDPAVISVGGSTTYRFYATTGYGGYYPLAKDGWLNDNISPLSSSGFTQNGRTIDMVAPGDLDFAVCTANPKLYEGCTDFAGKPSPVEESGGTSESAPLTAGAAALVIQAYRRAHGGASPTPALVKQLLTSTATDLGHPAAEQGAGRLDSYQAVLAALSVPGPGSPAAVGSTILSSATQLDAAARPGTPESWRLRLTNNGAAAQTLSLGQRVLGAPNNAQTHIVTLSDALSQHFTDYAGQRTNFEVQHITVAAHQDRLNVDLIYAGDPNASLNERVRLALIDPTGKFAAHSLPQGVGNAGHVDIRFPAAGSWTVMVWSRSSAVGGFAGPVQFRASTANYHATGSVSPASIRLAPGQTRSVTVRATTPGQPGDQANSVTIASSTGRHTSVPVALRSLVNLRTGGAYSGVLTGGNGRQFNAGQTGYLQFDVPRGQRDLTANFTLADNADDPVYGYLIDPAGNAQAYTANALVTGFDANGNPLATPQRSMSLFVRSPAAGRWTLILLLAPAATGTQFAEPFSGHIVLNAVRVGATGLPNSARVTLKAGVPVTVPVRVRNTGVAPQSFFIDPRLNKSVDLTLAQLAPSPSTLPLTPTSNQPIWNVPTETTRIQVGVSATVPVNFDLGWLFGFGDPDVAGVSTGTTATATFTGRPVPSGLWSATPAEIGPFGANPPPAATAVASMTATTQAFDPAVTTPIGNFEFGAVDPTTSTSIITVLPGQTLTIPVTITPRAAKGTVVSGQLYVDDLAFLTVLGAIPAGQELAALPYRYTVG